MRTICLTTAALILGSLMPAGAQPFLLQINRDGNVTEAIAGASIDLRAPAIGSDSQVTITAVYMGVQSAKILLTDLLGRTDFTLQGTSTPTLKPGERYSFSVRYHATTSEFEQALLTVSYQEAPVPPAVTSPVASFRLSLTGAAPDIGVSYYTAADRTSRALANNAQIDLPALALGLTAQATVTIANTGSGPAVIRSAGVSGSLFQLSSGNAFPYTIAAGQSLPLTIQVSPLTAGPVSTTLKIDGPGGPFAYTLTASFFATKPVFSLVTSAGSTPLATGSTISFPDTLLGSQSKASLRVSNPTPSTLSIPDAAITGSTDYQLLSLVPLPLTLAAGESRDLSLAFSPTRAQASTATLKLGTDSFLLSGIGLASALGFSYVTANGVGLLDPNGTATLLPAAIGNSQTVTFVARNLTAQNIILGQAGIAEANAAFSIGTPSPFPATLAPQQEVRFQVVFAPQTTGLLTGTLVVDSYLFTLRAVALAPAKLPEVSVTGPAGPYNALQQVSAGVTLAAPYPVDINGTLTMSFDSSTLAADPSLQFSSGGRTATFKITAGSLAARFAGGSTKIGLQTGSVAGTIRLTATVQTTANFDLSGSNQASMALAVTDTAPSILNVTVTGSSGSFQIQILGMTTNRALSVLSLQLAPTGLINLNATSFKLDVGTPAAVWFRDTASLQFGGLFTLSVPLQITLPDTTTTSTTTTTTPTLADLIRSITVKAANSVGESAPFTLNLQ